MPMRPLESILGADDDPGARAVVRASLRLIPGLDVRMTRSGEQLIKLASERPPDLVLLDVMMPGLDGPSTLRRMRESALLQQIPAIFITGRAMLAEIRRVLPVGALGFIAKSSDPLKLGNQITALWNRSETAAATADRPPPAPLHVEGLAARFLRRAAADLALLRAKIKQACVGDACALKEVERIAHKMHGSAAMVGFHRLSVIGEAIERLAATVVSDLEGHGPIAESALVQQISGCIEQLAAAVDLEQSTTASSRAAREEAAF
jgi:CheY-like chemotaxis protein